MVSIMIDYDLAFNIIVTASTFMVVFTIFLSLYYLTYFFTARRKVAQVPASENYTKFGVLIAARNESKVIRNIFEALKKQTYPKEFFDVWIIVEDEKDASVAIANEFGYKYFVRDNLTDDRHTKGFALQEMINYFNRENIAYDAYMIFDADNVMEPNFIELMNNLRQTGVKVGSGYRNFTNVNVNWLTSTSSVMFAYMNQVTSKGRSYLFHKATLMGTGYYVDKSIIDDAGGWIFTGMTEDIQLTSYCYYHDVNMRYYPDAVFYDEQSPKFKQVHNQHVRWLSGFFASRKYLKKSGVNYPYHKKRQKALMLSEFKIGILPFIIYNIINALLLIASLGLAIGATLTRKEPDLIWRCWGITIYEFLCLWLPFVIASMYIIISEHKRMHMKPLMAVICSCTYMFFFYDFLAAFIDLGIHKEKRHSWVQIEHTGKTEKEKKHE